MTLTAGSIAFVGFNADGNDGFAFIAIDPIPAGAVIRFQDNEWNGLNIGSGGAFNTGEGSFSWTNSGSDLVPGTIVEFLNTSLASRSATIGTITGGTLALGNSGESIFAFVGTSETSPIAFLAAITNNNGGFNGATTSGLLGGTGLTVGSTALVLPGTGGADVAAYNPAVGGSTFATREAALTAFNTASNWIAQDASGNQDADDIPPDAPFLTDPQSPIAGVTFTIGSPTPIVTITALDATAAEAGQDPGTFRISRTGATTSALTVSYTIATGTGQATSGVDYTPSLTGSVEIPVGQSFVDITITPVDDTAVEGDETVTLTLVDTADYDLGTDTTATITITDNDVAVGNLQITEYMYDGANGEFVEFTNVGNAPVDMTGWSFDDNSRAPGSFDLSAFGIVQPGESVILTEASAAAFRTAWSLPNSVKVIGGLGGSNNLGRADEINLYDNNGTLVDRLTYGDQTFPGTIRTQTRSGWAPVNQLADQIIDADWVLSSVNDAQNSRTSTGGDIGNPGHFNTGAPGVLLIESGASTNVTEGGATDTYTLVLRSQPTADVVITLNPGSQLTTSATTVTFTPGNWNIAQTVIVTAVDDTVVEGTHPGTITHTVTSTDANYDGLGVTTVTATITDNDFASLPPTIAEASATPFLNLPATGSGFASGVVGDPTDPARVFGIDFTIADPDTAVGDLVVTVTSSNTAVVPNANLTLSGTGATRNLKIDPVGVGFANITVTVSDGANTDSYVINYAASAAASTPTSTRFHTGASDASTAIALDANYMLVADDEDQTIRLYDRNGSGLPLASFDFTSFLGLSGSSEVDIEASTRLGNTIYWLGSHSNNSSGADRPNRERLFATQVSGTGASTSLTFTGYYQFLEDDLIAWDNANGHGLGAGFLGLAASAANGVLPEQTNGFNIEGLTLAPNNTTGYVSFRAPNQPTGDRHQALIIPVTNFTSLVSPTGGTAGSATFGAPIFLDLGGRGIRSIERNNTGEYVIIAGPAGAATGTAPADFRLYTWDGNPASAPVLRNADLTALNTGGSFEGIVEVPDNLTSASQIQLLVDNGDTIWYNNGVISKDLEAPTFNKALQKFRSDVVTLGDPVTPPVVVPPGAIPLSTPYSQDFNSLISTGTATWVDNVIEGWYTARTGTGTGIAASNGSATGGNLYSFGATSDSDRALGSIGSGNVAAGNFFWGARFFNDTNSTIDTIYINYFGEQWRNGGNATAQTVDFQYQIGATSLTTGTWANADSLDFTSLVNTTTAAALNGNASANRTLISGSITGLSLAPGQDIWFRWVDIDHPGSDHGMAIDDLLVSTVPLAGITLLESGGSTNVAEGGATDTYTIALNTVPNAPVAITIAANDGQTLLSLDGVTFLPAVLLNLTNTTPATITVKAVDDAAVEGLHTGIITHSISSTDTLYNSLLVPSVIASIVDNDVLLTITKIHQIQGNVTTQLPGGVHNDVSPLNGQTVTIEGIVTADFQRTNQLRGFFIQEETVDEDGDSTTSEGIFVFTGNTPPLDVQEGQKVRITGVVSEFFGMTQVNATAAGSITLMDGGNNLGLITPAVISLPVTGDLNDYYEQFEGMKVQFNDKLVVSEYFELARYGQLMLTKDARPFQYSHLDDTPTAAEYSAFLDALKRSRIILDDDNNIQNAPLPNGVFPYPQPGGLSIGTQGTNYFRGGDSITGLTGVLHWSFAGLSGTDAWRIRPTQANPISFTVENPRPTTPPDVGGNIKVASFNVLNYFTTIDTVGGSNSPRGADSEDEFNRQNEKLMAALQGINADVFGLIEIENNGGLAIQTLVQNLNAVVGAGTYAYINTGVVGTDAITVAIIYKPAVVQPKGAVAILDVPAFTDPNNTGAQRNRPAIAQTFEVIDPNNPDFGEVFNVVVNHLKSKGSATGAPADEDQNDGQGASNDTRTKAAAYLANVWIPSDPTGQGDPDWLIIGDLNAYKGETPITTLKNAGYIDLVEQFGGPNAYSYVFNGQLGYLDYALANASLASQVTGVAEWHINADEVPVFDYNNTVDDGAGEQSFEAKPTGNPLYEPNAFRTSDHDPVIIGLNLFATPKVNGQTATIFVNDRNTVVGNAFQVGQTPYLGSLFSKTDGTANPNDVILGTPGDDIIWAGTEGNDLINSGAGNDTIGISAGNSTVYAGFGDDFVYTTSATSGTNTIDLGSGDNGAWLAVGNNTVTAGSGTDTIGIGSGNNSLNLSGGDDFVYVIDDYTAGTNIINLGEGDNSAWLPTGNNTVTAGNGTNAVGIGSGNNTVTTGSGNDFVYTIRGGGGTNILNLGDGNNGVWLESGNYTITTGSGNDLLGLGMGNDTVHAGDGNNVIYMLNAATAGNKDILTGAGNDYVQTGAGSDFIDAGLGFNTLYGGTGADIFVARNGAYNYLGDFEVGSDRIQLVDVTFANLSFFQGSGASAADVFAFNGSNLLLQVANTTVAQLNNGVNFI